MIIIITLIKYLRQFSTFMQIYKKQTRRECLENTTPLYHFAFQTENRFRGISMKLVNLCKYPLISVYFTKLIHYFD